MDKASLALLAFALALPGSLASQVGPHPVHGKRVSSTAAAQLKGSAIAGEGRLQVGGWAGLVFGGRLAIGGAGFALLREVELEASDAAIGFDLGMGYGGLYFAYWKPFSSRVSGQLGVLAAAAHAEVRDRLVGREVGSDNFPVLEPDLSLFLTLRPHVHVGASLGYRLAWDVDDLPTVSAEDMRATTGTLSLRIGTR